MRKTIALLPSVNLWVLAILWAGSAVFAQMLETAPVVTAPQVAVAPVCDGALDDPAWENAATLSDFVVVGTGVRPRYQTQVKIAFDPKGLHIGVRMFSPPGAPLKADATERDGPVLSDDAFVLVLDTDNGRQNYAVIATNPAGTRYDSANGDPKRNFSWTCAARPLEDGWSAELCLAFRDGISPREGERWGLGVGRISPGQGETSGWALHQQGLEEVGALGTLIFAGSPLSAAIQDMGAMWLGRNVALAHVRNLSGNAVSCKLNVRVTGRDQYGHFFAATKADLEPGASTSLTAAYRIVQDGPGSILFSLTDAEGRTAWRSAPYSFHTPAVMEALDAALVELTAAWQAWAARPLDARNPAERARLDELTERWTYLDTRYRDRERVVRPEAMALELEAQSIARDAKLLRASL